jgi:hypothetical protein
MNQLPRRFTPAVLSSNRMIADNKLCLCLRDSYRARPELLTFIWSDITNNTNHCHEPVLLIKH